jgi:uncharacterized protein YbgA (DUF1722 family)
MTTLSEEKTWFSLEPFQQQRYLLGSAETVLSLSILDRFKQALSADEKHELLEVIDQYRQEYVPLIVPVTLMKHYVRKYDEPYLKEQVYLNSHALELKLRNHV